MRRRLDWHLLLTHRYGAGVPEVARQCAEAGRDVRGQVAEYAAAGCQYLIAKPACEPDELTDQCAGERRSGGWKRRRMRIAYIGTFSRYEPGISATEQLVLGLRSYLDGTHGALGTDGERVECLLGDDQGDPATGV